MTNLPSQPFSSILSHLLKYSDRQFAGLLMSFVQYYNLASLFIILYVVFDVCSVVFSCNSLQYYFSEAVVVSSNFSRIYV